MNKKSVVALIIAVIIAAVIATPFIIWNAMKPQDEITTGALVEKMNDLNELVTAEAITKVAIQKENNKIFGQEINLDIPGTGQKLLVIVPGTVQAGVDLDDVTKKNVTVDNKNKKIILRLPKVEILGNPSLDLDKVKVFSSEGIFRSDATVKEGYELANEAQQLMTQEAIDEGILQKAQTNAEQSLKNMFDLVDYEVEVMFEE